MSNRKGSTTHRKRNHRGQFLPQRLPPKKVIVCQCCGHPLPAPGIENALSPIRARMYRFLQRAGAAGLPQDELLGLIYQDDPSGGPDSTNIIAVMRTQLNHDLSRVGLTIESDGGRYARYRLRKL